MKRLNRSLAMGLVGLLATFAVNAQKDGEYHLDQTYTIATNGTLYLDSEDANVNITGSSRTDAHVKIDRVVETRGFSSGRNEFRFDVEDRAGNLYLTERRRGGVTVQVGYSRTDYTINIELPRSVSLKVKGEDDDYIIRNIDGKISIESEDGDIEVIDCHGSDFQFKLEDGDLKVEGGNGAISVDIEDGDVDIRKGNFDRIEMDVQDGSVILETAIADNGIYDIKAEDARVDFVVIKGGGEFLVLKDDGSLRTSSDFETLQESDHRSLVKLAGGNAKIEIRTGDGRVRLSKQ
ncbi:MAG: hypothetical protein COW03_17305 [Cytophagales bacterium CG12_big_fil_rev_8_21_14_0_65_40_12]|nr:MAG: hypothetical protein COW03_17305 [Cytophagales bacterium CG12_big_fil_rev_8_21_14_0_65_40_12]PIW02965.1 MAG: hypothetical protein COW40_16570 [Cytophagales bacterium CG17_big_fil_post_rev_8_21_14_2_50_40_13]